MTAASPLDVQATPLHALEVNYHALLANSPDTVVLFDLDQDRLVDANHNAEVLFGLPEAQLLSKNLADLCPPVQPGGQSSHAHLRAQVARVAAGDIRVFEATFIHRDGHSADCEMRLVMLPVAGRRLLHARIVDISRRKLDDRLRTGQGKLLEMVARGAPLRDTLDQLMLLIENQSRGVFCSVLLLDEDGIHMHPGSGPSLPREYMDALEGFPIGPDVGSCGTAMYRKEAVIVSDIMNDPLWAPYKALVEPHGLRACWSTPIFLDRAQVLGSFAMYYKEVRSPKEDDMRLIEVATHLAGIAIERTRRERELALHREHLEDLVAARTAELTAEKNRTELANEELAATLEHLSLAQEEIVRRDKLAALGSLVTGIAHELNTPIGNSLVMASTVSDHARELGASLQDGLRRSTLDAYLHETGEIGDILVRNLQRAADLLSNFKQIAVDHTSSQRRRFSLSQVMTDMLPALRATARAYPVAVDLAIDHEVWLDSYPGALTQVLLNIFDNCLVHAFEGGRSGTIHLGVEQRPHDLVAVMIEDNGAGIAPGLIARVFDPFFTTKLGSGGSGLGLHIAHNIVTAILGGRIDVSSNIGIGTTFTLLLPVIAPEFTREA
ncbi:MAG: ATP-binding protein [Pseudomonadota bacterium]